MIGARPNDFEFLDGFQMGATSRNVARQVARERCSTSERVGWMRYSVTDWHKKTGRWAPGP